MSDYVSEESFLLIFKSLPVKTLLRFRCVCKWWKGLIDAHSFVQEHLAFQKPRFIVDYEVPNEFLVLDPLTLPLVDTLSGLIRAEPEQNLRLLGTLHGVVCLAANNSEYLLWNPSIRKFSIIPLPEVIEVEMFDGGEERIYNYTLSSFFEWDDGEIATFSGFWIDPSTKDFKIITFKLLRSDEDCDIPLHGIFYSSIIQDWLQATKLDPIFYNCRPMPGAPPVMVGDVAYWRACVGKAVMEDEEDEEEQEHEEHERAAILWFDFVKEKFGYIEVPNKDYSGYFQPVHCRLQGGLSLVYWDSKFPFRCDIYSRKEDEWVKMIDFWLLSPTAFHIFCVLEEMADRWRSLAIDGRALVAYDTKDGTKVLRSGIKNPIIYIFNDFVESLLFP